MKNVRAEIEAAFRRRLAASVAYDGWEERESAEAALALAADRLTIIANRGAEVGRPEQFREVGRGTAQSELGALAADAQAIIERVEKMIERTGALHATTIDALAAGLVPRSLARASRGDAEGLSFWKSETGISLYAADSTIDDLASEVLTSATITRRARAVIKMIQPLAAAFAAADVSGTPETAGRGRPQKHLAAFVAQDVLQVLEKITGGCADLPAETGGLPGAVPLVGEIFALLAIEADAKVAVKNMLDEREEQKQWAGDPSPPA